MEIARLLLDRGADPNGITFDERGPLLKPPLGEYFNANDDPDPALVRLLLKYGARIVLKVSHIYTFILPPPTFPSSLARPNYLFILLLPLPLQQPQSQDPLGILKCIHRLDPESEVFDLIVTNFDSLSITCISKCQLLSSKQTSLLLKAASSPPPLKHLLRKLIRQLLGPFGPFLIEKVADLPLPDLLQRYLLYDLK